MSEYVERIPAGKSVLRRGKDTLLLQLDMELTERCNNDCIHCWINLPAEDATALARELPTEEVKRILREAAELGCLHVGFTGGEPLLREDFEELYVFARRLGLRVLISTNARLITPRLSDLFARIPPLIEIEISAYGMRAESYESVTRIAGSYAQFYRGVNLLLDRSVPFIVTSALLPPNRSEMDEFEDWASSIPWMKETPLYTMGFDFRKRRDSAEKNRQIELLRASSGDVLAVLSRRTEQESRPWLELCRKRMKPSDDGLFQCGAGRVGCVDAYGRYQACMSLSAPEWTYDLRRNSLREAIEASNAQIRQARSTNPEYFNHCARCLIRPLCEQCPAKSWLEHGTLDTRVEHLCAAAHAQAERMGLLRTDEKAWNVLDWEGRSEIVSNNRSGRHGQKKVV